jgi:hypothetical protein
MKQTKEQKRFYRTIAQFRNPFPNLKKIASLEVELFRARHPDVKPNSKMENDIAKLIQAGEQPEVAYKIVWYYNKKRLL